MDPKEIVQTFIAAHNRHDIDGMLDMLTDDAEITDPATPIPLHGKASIRPQYELIFGAIPDINFEITHMISEGGQVFTAVHTTGTGAGKFLDNDITGIEIELLESLLCRVEDGKIAWGQFYSDTAKLARTLGYRPNPD